MSSTGGRCSADLKRATTSRSTQAADDLNQRLGRGVESLLLVGLSRAFRKDDDEQDRHWLPVNGICMADRPLGERP
jgi:hypothetical protein